MWVYHVWLTYLIVQVFERECHKFALWNTGNTEVKPGLVVVSVHMRCCVMGYPEVETILLISALGSWQVSGAELAAEHDFALGNLPSGSLWVLVDHFLIVDRLKRWQFLAISLHTVWMSALMLIQPCSFLSGGWAVRSLWEVSELPTTSWFDDLRVSCLTFAEVVIIRCNLLIVFFFRWFHLFQSLNFLAEFNLSVVKLYSVFRLLQLWIKPLTMWEIPS